MGLFDGIIGMTILILVTALLVERFFDWSHIRSWSWYGHYQQTISNKLVGQPTWIRLVAIILPLLFIILLIELLVQNWLYGVAKFLFHLFILLYSLGPQNFWADMFSCINAIDHSDPRLANEKLNVTFDVSVDDPALFHQRFLPNIFIEANRRVFAVLFWYVFLGPVAVVLYRLLALTANPTHQFSISIDLSERALSGQKILDWLPIRLFIFIFALGGHFVQVLSCIRKKVFTAPAENEILLASCGLAALGSDSEKLVTLDSTWEKHAISLIDRAIVIFAVITIIVVLLS